MLVRLFGKNFRSLRDEFELSMVAADLKNEEDRNRGVIEVPLDGLDEPLRLLRVVALYGANASGKSAVLQAASALEWLVSDSSRQMGPGEEIRCFEPFLLAESANKSTVTLGCEVILLNKVIHFEIEFGATEIVSEKLEVLGIDDADTLFERHQDDITGSLISSSDANALYVRDMQPNISVLSKLGQHGPAKGPESVRPFLFAIRRSLQFRDYASATGGLPPFSTMAEEKFAEDSDYQDWIMSNLILKADIGIDAVNTRREAVELPDMIKELAERDTGIQFPKESVVVNFRHQGDVGRFLDFSDESAGTRKLFNISSDLWLTANEDVTLFIDELGASLHPILLDHIVRAANRNELRKSNAQLIFTTHDSGLMEGRNGLPPAIRRDQIFFTGKGNDGATELFSLFEFKDQARGVHNIRKRYMSGLYNAIPIIEKIDL